MATYAKIISSTSSLTGTIVATSGVFTYTVPDGANIRSLYSVSVTGTRTSGGGLGISATLSVLDPLTSIVLYSQAISDNTAGNGVHSASTLTTGTPPTNIPEGSIIQLSMTKDVQWSTATGAVYFLMEENS